MKTIYFAGAAAAALIIGFGGVQFADENEGVPFINPLTIVRSACGKDPAAALKRRIYFRSIGAAYAAMLKDESDAANPAKAHMRPVPGIGYAVTTANDKAQAYFDAGLAHVWNFNHGEAVNEFKMAQADDPDCAMCYWAEAFALGPNINAPMGEEAVVPAYAAIQKAVSLKDKASEKERALIDALAARYAAKPVADRSALDAAFADAMDKVALAYPDDDFILALAAEANMDTQPWDYWQADGRTPKGRAARTISLIETVLARNPDYQPAIHLYIHMTEATDNPYRAVAYADKLAKLSPSLGHLIHMPSHTYARVGRFKDSIDTNINAVASDETFLANSDPSPLYQYGYYVHNVHFVMTSAQMAGDKDTALAMAKKLDAKLPAEMAVAVPFAQPIKVAPYFAMVQFAAPEEILALEAPGEETPFMQAAWHYARGEAFAMMGDAEKARGEAEAISQIRATADFSGLVENLVPAPDVLKIEQLTVTARAAALDGDLSTAIEAMEEAVATQEGLNYTEPPYWYYPAKQTLAAMVLRSGDAERAEQLFIETLAELPNNGWSYVGLAEAYKAQGDKNARKYAEGLMKSAWIGKEKPALERL
ncbi:MAG: tetratricopeptide repeat protein [Parvularculaceae bacterium]